MLTPGYNSRSSSDISHTGQECADTTKTDQSVRLFVQIKGMLTPGYNTGQTVRLLEQVKVVPTLAVGQTVTFLIQSQRCADTTTQFKL